MDDGLHEKLSNMLDIIFNCNKEDDDVRGTYFLKQNADGKTFTVESKITHVKNDNKKASEDNEKLP